MLDLRCIEHNTSLLDQFFKDIEDLSFDVSTSLYQIVYSFTIDGDDLDSVSADLDQVVKDLGNYREKSSKYLIVFWTLTEASYGIKVIKIS